MLSMVATRRSFESLSGASAPSARHAPLNSSIFEMSLRSSGLIFRVSDLIISHFTPIFTPNYTQLLRIIYGFPIFYTQLHPF